MWRIRPWLRIERIDPAEPTDRIDPAEPKDRIDPAEPTDNIEPAEAIDRMEPTEATDRIEPTDPTDRIENGDAIERLDRTVMAILDIMAAREVIVLGTAAMAPTRQRAHNSCALRWDDQLILFDPGEGTQRGAILAGVAVPRVTAVCITHFHGDHCLGLPGVIQRRSLDAADADPPLPTLPVFHPADGQAYFDRLRSATIFHDTDAVESRPIVAGGEVATLGRFRLRAEPLEHRAPTFGYRLDEPDGWSVDPARLEASGISGPDVGRLVRDGWLDTPTGRVSREEVSVPKPGQSMAFVMDTRPCESALALADRVDLLVCEATYRDADAALAESYFHMTAGQAGQLAREAGVGRLVLTHFSARYESTAGFAEEASRHHDDVVVADDLAVVEVPPRRA